MDNENVPMHQHIQIPLDGSYGAGPEAEVTIITKVPDSSSLKRQTFSIPYFMVDIPRLMKLNEMNFILGFEIIKGEKTPSQLKELGLL